MVQTKQAFTLIELLIVVLIIGILAAVALPQYRLAVEKAHAAEAIAQVKALAEAEQVYYLSNGEYADTFDKLDIDFTGEMRTDKKAIIQKNWDLKLGELPNYVYASRLGYEFKNGRWYIAYDLQKHQLVCQAYHEDAFSNKICKIYGDLTDCPADDDDTDINCYRLP